MNRKAYPSNLSDAEVGKTCPTTAKASNIRSPRHVERREVMNVLMYVANNGIKWRSLPHDLPRQILYGDFRSLSASGV